MFQSFEHTDQVWADGCRLTDDFWIYSPVDLGLLVERYSKWTPDENQIAIGFIWNAKVYFQICDSGCPSILRIPTKTPSPDAIVALWEFQPVAKDSKGTFLRNQRLTWRKQPKIPGCTSLGLFSPQKTILSKAK